jgi:hypothetical protein
MPREFRNMKAFLKFAEQMERDAKAAIANGVEVATRQVWKEARSELGVYQRDTIAGMHPWPELAKATQADRRTQGFPANEPLYRQGLLHDNTKMSTDETRGRVGVPSAIVQHDYAEEPVDIGDVAIWQELGTKSARGSPEETDHTPARSFLARAAARWQDRVVDIVAGRLVWALRGNGARRDDL